MKKIENLQDVWDNGFSTPAPLSFDEINRFKLLTNASKVVTRKWLYGGNPYEIPYQVRVLPDRSGLIHYENGVPHSRRLVVLNGDGTPRVVINVPKIDENSCPEKGYLALPPSLASFGGIEWGCEGNDGCMDYLFDFDWTTGALLRYARPTRPW